MIRASVTFDVFTVRSFRRAKAYRQLEDVPELWSSSRSDVQILLQSAPA